MSLAPLTFSVKTIWLWVEGVCEGRVLNLFARLTLNNLDEVCNKLDDRMLAGLDEDDLTFHVTG